MKIPAERLQWLDEHGAFDIQPIGYQGPAQHTYTAACDGFHEPGQCPKPEQERCDD